jgi:hypothetical protein
VIASRRVLLPEDQERVALRLQLDADDFQPIAAGAPRPAGDEEEHVFLKVDRVHLELSDHAVGRFRAPEHADQFFPAADRLLHGGVSELRRGDRPADRDAGVNRNAAARGIAHVGRRRGRRLVRRGLPAYADLAVEAVEEDHRGRVSEDRDGGAVGPVERRVQNQQLARLVHLRPVDLDAEPAARLRPAQDNDEHLLLEIDRIHLQRLLDELRHLDARPPVGRQVARLDQLVLAANNNPSLVLADGPRRVWLGVGPRGLGEDFHLPARGR